MLSFLEISYLSFINTLMIAIIGSMLACGGVFLLVSLIIEIRYIRRKRELKALMMKIEIGMERSTVKEIFINNKCLQDSLNDRFITKSLKGEEFEIIISYHEDKVINISSRLEEL